jgi:hypothetical protein
MSTSEESVASMFERAIELTRGIDDRAGFDLIAKIIERRDKAFDIAVWRLRAGDDTERALAVYILGVLSAARNEAEPDMVARLVEVGKREKSSGVQHALAVAFRHSNDPRAIPLLLNWLKSGEATFRRSVVETLSGCIERNRGPEGMDELIRTTNDHIDEVRNWATYGLGLIIRRDNAKIRDALWARVDDENPDTRRAAVAGLARRRDQGIIPVVLAALQGDEVARLDLEAASYLRSKKLLPALRELEEWWDLDPELLDHAIDLCDIKVEARNFAEYDKFRRQLEGQLLPMYPGIEVTLACDLMIDSGPTIVVASNYDFDISYPTVPQLLAQQQGNVEAAAALFSEIVQRDDRLGRRQQRRK